MTVEMTIRLVLIATLVSLIVVGFAMGEDTYSGHRKHEDSPEQPSVAPEAEPIAAQADAS